jgi:hypothetical protein
MMSWQAWLQKELASHTAHARAPVAQMCGTRRLQGHQEIGRIPSSINESDLDALQSILEGGNYGKGTAVHAAPGGALHAAIH